MGEIVEFKDFSRPPRQVKFKVGQQDYDAMPALPLGMAVDLGLLAKSLATGEIAEKIQVMWELFDGLLQGDGGSRLKTQAYDKQDPLDLTQTMSIIAWLLEVYGLRPTEPSSDSLSGESPTGTSSTDGAPHAESIPSDSLSLGS